MEVVIVAIAQKEKEADNMDEGWRPSISQRDMPTLVYSPLSGQDLRATEGFFPK